MDKIEVGEFVRTYDGDIFEFSGYCGNINSMTDKFGILYGNQSKCCKKHSKNIIDLIEEGDIIEFEYGNIVYISEVLEFWNGDLTYLEVCFSPADGVGYNMNIFDEDIIIKSILTHEQFNQNKYEVEGRA